MSMELSDKERLEVARELGDEAITRLACVEKIRWKKFNVLTSGFVCLVDVMGDDYSVVQAARVSYGKGTRHVSNDQALISYLMRHRHTTPFEMAEIKLLVKCPMDVWRQWIRHRTACLTGDTPLVFSRPSDGKAYRLTVAEVFDRFQPTENTQRPDKQGNAYFKRDRVQGMQLRSVNEETGEVLHTNVVDVWQSGVKQVYRIQVETSHGVREVRASKDHLFFCGDGWSKLEDLTAGDEVVTVSSREGVPAAEFNVVDPDCEEWSAIVGWEDYYEVSTQGRVRRIVGGKGSRSHGRCKKLTVSNERAVTSLNRPGEQTTILVHREMLRSFVGEPEDGEEARHRNGNSLDNRIENLRWGSSSQNAGDMVEHGRSTFLCSQRCKILSIEPAGEEMTYDVEVAGPWHNFSANDVIVHNSVNEYSTRYSVAIDEADRTNPDAWRLQSGRNKQGSEGLVTAWPDGYTVEEVQDGYTVKHPDRDDFFCGDATSPGAYLSAREEAAQNTMRVLYEERVDQFGVAREQARKDLPLSTYTMAYWKIDLHNLLHFLGLRMDSHAQQEIRCFADAIGYGIVAPLFPMVWEAFVKYRMHATFVSEPAKEVLEYLLIRFGDSGDELWVNQGVYTKDAFDVAVTELFPKWMKRDDEGNLKPHREREEVRSTLTQLGLVSGE